MSTTSNSATQLEDSISSNTASPSVPDHITFSDGDVVLKSCGGKEFRVHSVILREASTVFRDMLKLPGAGSQDHAPILMAESGDVLDDLLRWLYPIATAPTINTIVHALALLRVVEKFQIESHAIDGALTAYLNKQQSPVRAWALATRFDLLEGRKAATRRILMTNTDLLDDIPPEMDIVDAKSYMKLLLVKRDAVGWARRIIASELLDCGTCTHPGSAYARQTQSRWHSQYCERLAEGNPFDPILTSDLMAEMYVSIHGGTCCKDRFKAGGSHARTMHNLRTHIQEVLKKAVHAECHGTKFP